MDRDGLQEKIAKSCLGENKGILDISMRFGKCRIGVLMLQALNSPKVLITYPDNKIKNSWLEEFEKMEYDDSGVTFSSNRSIHKHEDGDFDVIFVDECHKLSEKNVESLKKLLKAVKRAYFFTGTLSRNTEYTLLKDLGLRVIASYSQDQAIADGIVSDYRINVITVPLDDKQLIQYKKKRKTEKKQFNAYSWVINKMEEEGKDTFSLRLARMRLIQNSIAKMRATRKLLSQFKDERILVFCGLIKVADELGIPVEHSKSEGGILEKFKKGEINHAAVVKMGASGQTYPKLHKVVLNYCSSNEDDFRQMLGRATNLDFDGKIAEVYVICSTEKVEKDWLHKAFASMDPAKIKWL